MPGLTLFCLLYVFEIAFSADPLTYNQSTKACEEDIVEEKEYRELGAAKVELLQLRSAWNGTGRRTNIDEHRYLLVRPCERFAGDGMSGLPRHRVTGECCGDDACSTDRWEEFATCPHDCAEAVSAPGRSTSKFVLPSTETSLFGTLEGLEHDEYHCHDLYDTAIDQDGIKSTCSNHPYRSSEWLEDLLERSKAGTLPFDLPPRGSSAVEFGAGHGQDSRNMAKLAGYAVTAIDVSPSAIEEAKNYTPPEMLGAGAGQIEFVAYDAMALPAPKKRVDFFFDATVYCSLRHSYLSKMYKTWSGLFTPGHTLVLIQCWNLDSNNYTTIPQSERDMKADFEPHFELLHNEECAKNQGNRGWCFYMKLKDPEVRNSIVQDRLKLQQAVRDGNTDYVEKTFEERFESISEEELWTLYFIAEANGNAHLMKYLSSASHQHSDEFAKLVYGEDFEMANVESEDQLDGSQSVLARVELESLKTNWEKREAELVLQTRKRP